MLKKTKMIVICSLVMVMLMGSMNVFANNGYIDKLRINIEEAEIKSQMILDQVKEEEKELLKKLEMFNKDYHGTQEITPYEFPGEHWCHPGDRHDRCIELKPKADVCGCIYSGYKCCCGVIVKANVAYCDSHGWN
ncbi:hypothetical protein [Alkaliphilus oremlandii]|uniref:Uncharacterized protein n=1 Tax=Alkaliphilus oremlandii (strain OhILAs) TaxID=350688 RepID=A8MJ04_ALKOO|nr:hypothetical protein [Alkaliphilus oremlandii]ABW19786.1 hypothetical protein Clos_2253 [Alkaliphilus oremlandii OhILAs]